MQITVYLLIILLEPIFEGMPKLNFNKETSEKGWQNISNQLLNFYAPRDAALILPKAK